MKIQNCTAILSPIVTSLIVLILTFFSFIQEECGSIYNDRNQDTKVNFENIKISNELLFSNSLQTDSLETRSSEKLGQAGLVLTSSLDSD